MDIYMGPFIYIYMCKYVATAQKNPGVIRAVCVDRNPSRWKQGGGGSGGVEEKKKGTT